MLPKQSGFIGCKKDLPTGPIISNADGAKSQKQNVSRHVENKNDEVNFENMTSELYKVTLDGTATLFKSRYVCGKASRLMAITLC
jgi:hypothetical protein